MRNTTSVTVGARVAVAIIGAVACGSAFAAQLLYSANLSGANEFPPNASPGVGGALITVDTSALTMRVQTNFSGLTGTTTAAHIHCCTVVPNTGTAGVATPTPSFPGFPAGVTAGMYDQTFDMTQASSYNPAFVTAQGSVANARAALFGGLQSGTAYLNIHTTAFGGGEIRAFPAAVAGGPQRTFVSTINGLDSNPCSLTQPCRGFAAAVAAVAPGGEVIALDSGGYGPVTITKSVSIVSPPGVYAGISVLPGNDGIVVNGPFATVALKGLTINGQGGNAGIDFVQGSELTVEHCEIVNVGGSNTAGIYARAMGGKVVVRDTVVRDTIYVGIWVKQAVAGQATTLVADNVAVHNASPWGIFVGGFAHAGTAEAYLTRVTVTGSSFTGITSEAVGGTTLASIANSTVSGNTVGVFASFAGGKVIVATSTLARNASFAMTNNSATLLSRGDNTVHDNNGGGAQTSGAIGPLPPL